MIVHAEQLFAAMASAASHIVRSSGSLRIYFPWVGAIAGAALGCFLTAPAAGQGSDWLPELRPLTVAPGGADRFETLGTACPTFHWSLFEGAIAYQLAVLPLATEEHEQDADDVAPSPVLEKRLPGGVGSWTPPREGCPPAGDYDWYLRALVPDRWGSEIWTEWSSALYFAVEDSEHDAANGGESAGRLRQASDGGRQELGLAASRSPSADHSPMTSELGENRSASGDRSRPGDSDHTSLTAVASGGNAAPTAAFRAASTQPGLESYAISADSLNGAAVLATGGATAPDLVLDGSRHGVPSTLVSESELVRTSLSTTSFNFRNPGGDFQLEVQGLPVVTTASDQDTLGDLSCSDGEAPVYGSGSGWECSSGRVDAAWQLQGNPSAAAGDFLGTLDATPLELRINNQPAFRLIWGDASPGPSGPNIVAGAAENTIAANLYAATIAGGGVAPAPNSVAAAGGSIGGGIGNLVAGGDGVVGGGSSNVIGVTSLAGTVAGGASNQVTGSYGSVPGGRHNVAGGSYSVATGRQSQALHDNTFVFNDGGGTFASTANSQFLIDVADGVGIGTNDPSDLLHINAPSGRDALRVQIGGTTRLRVHDNGGVSVGVNSAPPAAGLLVEGDLEVRGDYRTASPITRWATFAPPTFPCRDRCGFVEGARMGCLAGPFCYHEMAVALPHGSQMTSFQMRVDDTTGTGNVFVSLYRVALSTNERDVVARLDSDDVAQGEKVLVTDTTISGSTIDNQDYLYYFTVSMAAEGIPLGLYWVQITYEISDLVP